MKARKKD